ncbi:MAG: hypothetical protein ACRCTU_11790 [Zoogloea sp.]
MKTHAQEQGGFSPFMHQARPRHLSPLRQASAMIEKGFSTNQTLKPNRRNTPAGGTVSALEKAAKYYFS